MRNDNNTILITSDVVMAKDVFTIIGSICFEICF